MDSLGRRRRRSARSCNSNTSSASGHYGAAGNSPMAIALGATVIACALMGALPSANGFGFGNRPHTHEPPAQTLGPGKASMTMMAASPLQRTRVSPTDSPGTGAAFRGKHAAAPPTSANAVHKLAFVPRIHTTYSSSTRLLLSDSDEEESDFDEEEIVEEDDVSGGPDDEEEGEDFADEVDEIYEDEEEEYEEEFEYEEEGEGDIEAEYEDFGSEESEEYEPREDENAVEALGGYVEDEYIPLQEDPDDPNYNAQKKLLDESLPRLHAVATYKSFMKDQVEAEGISDFWEETLNDMFAEHLTEDELKLAEEKAKELAVTAEDLEGITDEDFEEAVDEIDSLEGEDAFPPDSPQLESRGMTNELLVNIDRAAKDYYKQKEALADGTWEGYCKFDVINETEELEKINVTDPILHGEMQMVLKEMKEDERPTYKAEKLLVYDLQFNMTNIFLAACKHNPEAPIILPQWLFQLEVYDRYADGQARNFEYSWEEATAADMTELEAYWKGLGHDTIPTRSEAETNIVTVERPDDDEVQMSHMQEWLKEVYNPEFDEVFFDDDKFMPYDSVYSDEYYQTGPPKDQVELQGLMDEFQDAIKAGNATEEEEKEVMQYMEGLVSLKNFTERIRYDSPEAAEFQGHLVVACSSEDADLEIAEKITSRFEKEFGRKIFVETRVFGHAKPEDHLFEIWLESYDIDLLHSKRRATFSSQTWEGPPQCDDAQIDYLVNEVNYLISDEHRYSYRIFEYEGIEEG